jgi:hypothetical protein
MRHSLCSRCALAGLALLFVGSSARSEFIPWSFHTTVTPTLLVSNNHPLGSVHFINTAASVVNSTHITLANLLVVSAAPYTAPDQFSARPFSIAMSITDSNSNLTQKMTFSGVVNGADTLYNSLLSFQFHTPTSQKLHIGSHWYTVTIDSISPPGPPSSGAYGSIGATVTVINNPEPSTLVLAVTAGVGLTAWRRWRSRASGRPEEDEDATGVRALPE